MIKINEAALIIIDPQIDFMDLPGSALPVPGASGDMKRLAKLITNRWSDFNAIFVTLDSHVYNHIAHPIRWLTADGKHPEPFTEITINDIDSGKFRASDPEKLKSQRQYVARLGERSQKNLMIWPPHCLIGSRGHAVEGNLFSALRFWMDKTGKTVKFVMKGMHPDTEQYGAFAADVYIRSAKETDINVPLMSEIDRYQIKFWAGEALSHCLMTSVEQMLNWNYDYAYEHVILTDCTSPVKGFEKMADDWLKKVEKKGVRLSSKYQEFYIFR